MNFVLNGKEHELDLLDVDVLEIFETAISNVTEKSNEIIKNIDEHQKLSEVIKKGCNTVFDFFDTVFGEGVAENIFNGKRNYKLCLKTYQECINQYTKFMQEGILKELNFVPSNLEKNKQNYQNYINARRKKCKK